MPKLSLFYKHQIKRMVMLPIKQLKRRKAVCYVATEIPTFDMYFKIQPAILSLCLEKHLELYFCNEQ